MRRLVQGLLLGAIVLDVAYWSLWFVDRSLLASASTRGYYEFENAFPLADAWLGVTCALAWLSLVRLWPSALFWLICAGSAGLYLFGMDFLYDVENGIYATGSGGVIEALINAVTLVFSLVILSWSWGHRGELLSGQVPG